MSMKNKRIYVAGHRGMVGSAIIRTLLAQGIAPSQIITRTHSELDLVNQADVEAFFATERPDQVYLAAAKVGGIHANNTFPGEFIYENLMVQANAIHAAHRHDVQELLFLGSSCIYPKLVPQPMPEAALLTAPLEPTNEPYAVAKIAGIKLCESYNRQYGRDYRSVMPTNLYGPGDNYHAENSHVVPALIRRFHEAKLAGAPEVTIWGSGTPRREFLYVDDMAKASVFIMNLEPGIYRQQVQPQLSHINVGYGSDVTIAELAQTVARVVDYSGHIVFDAGKPDGTPRKLMDSSRLLGMGWHPTIELEEGLALAYHDMQREMRSQWK
jgi:GDP-L-fucose synthase